MFIKDAINILEKMYQPGSDFRFSEREAALEAVKRLREIQNDEARRTVSGQEAKPVCWITCEQLTCVEDEGEDAWVYWAETGHVAEPDEVPLYAAPIPATELSDEISAFAERLSDAGYSKQADSLRRILAAAKEG